MDGEYEALVNSEVSELELLRKMLAGSELEEKYNSLIAADADLTEAKRQLEEALVVPRRRQEDARASLRAAMYPSSNSV